MKFNNNVFIFTIKSFYSSEKKITIRNQMTTNDTCYLGYSISWGGGRSLFAGGSGGSVNQGWCTACWSQGLLEFGPPLKGGVARRTKGNTIRNKKMEVVSCYRK